MVRVVSIDEAAVVVRFASYNDIPFTVRSGGVSTSGASTTHGGIVLDMSHLRKVHVYPDTRIVTVQGGALWEDVDTAASQYKLAVVGSTLNQIGAAGATLGGGYGWLTGQYGLAIDNLLWAKMILADGSIVTASQAQHPDLFWAIRGAGQSFGIAAELGFRAHEQNHHVFAGTLGFTVDKLAAIVDFANQFDATTDGKQGLWFGFTKLPSMAECSVLVVLFYNGPHAAAARFFGPILALESLFDGTQMLPYDSLNGILNTVDILTARRRSLPSSDISYPAKNKETSLRKSLRGSNVALPLDPEFVLSTYNDFNSIVSDYPETKDSRLLFELLPNKQVTAVPNDATAFASRGPYYNVTSLFEWSDPDLDDRICHLQRNLMEQIGLTAGVALQPNYQVSTHGTGIYANYAGMFSVFFRSFPFSPFPTLELVEMGQEGLLFTGHDVAIRDIFGDNLPRLRELKKNYDPHNTFKKWHNLNAAVDSPG